MDRVKTYTDSKSGMLSQPLLCILLTFSLSGVGYSQPSPKAQGSSPHGMIPPPDEMHASHPIGMCGTTHYEPRLEMCDTRDNQVYRIVTVGDQTWMADNLDYGKMVPGDQDQASPGEKYCLSDREKGCGALYQWAEAMRLDYSFNGKAAQLTGMVQGICPRGWHISNSAEWDSLLTLVDKEQGKENEAATLMYYSREDGFKWKTNTDPDSMLQRDKYGLEILSTGERVLKGQCPVRVGNNTYFCNAHDTAMFWTSDEVADDNSTIATGYVVTEDIPRVGQAADARAWRSGWRIPDGGCINEQDAGAEELSRRTEDLWLRDQVCEGLARGVRCRGR